MVGFGKLIVWCQPNRLFNIIFNRLWTSMLCSASCIWSCVTEFIDSPKVGVYKGILALWSLCGLNKPMFRWAVSWYEICNELKNVPKHPQQVNEYIESWDDHVAIEMDCFINGISDKLIGIPSSKDVKDTRSKPKKAKCYMQLSFWEVVRRLGVVDNHLKITLRIQWILEKKKKPW